MTEPVTGHDDAPVVRLERWPADAAGTADRADPVVDRVEATDASGTPANDDSLPDPFADLKADVAAFTVHDPLRTLEGLSQASGIPVGALARYVLAKWATGGNEALLELGTSGVDQLVRAIDDAEAAGSDAARLDAYHAMRQMIAWLRAG